MDQDQFNFQAGRDRAQPAGTRPLGGPSSTRPLVDGALLKQAEEILDALEERIELMHRASLAAGLRVPGLAPVTYRHALTPKAEKFVAYMRSLMLRSPEAVKPFQIGVFRFYQTAEQLGWPPPCLPRAGLEAVALRRELYVLSNLGRSLPTDPVLEQLFPKPPSEEGPLGPVQRLEQKRQMASALGKAAGLRAYLAPRMTLARAVLREVEKGPSLSGLFQPGVLQARLLALALRDDREARSRLKEACEALDQLEKLIARPPKTPSADYGKKLEALVFPLGRIEGEFLAHPVLKSLFEGG